MGDDPDYILDIPALTGQVPAAGPRDAAAQGGQDSDSDGPDDGDEAPAGSGARKWIGVHFTCCDVYSRVWRNREGTAYVGYCPRCRRKVQARVGPGGTNARFFEAG